VQDGLTRAHLRVFVDLDNTLQYTQQKMVGQVGPPQGFYFRIPAHEVLV
jgi:hypothetical protein